jgi:hypothetical protein
MARISIDLDKLKRVPLRLKVIAGVLVLDVLVLGLGYVVLNDVMALRVAQVDQLRNNVSQVRKQNVDLRRLADEYPDLRRRYDAAMADGIAAPLDRLALVGFAQGWAAHHHLSDLHYRLAAEPGKPAASQRYRVDTERVVFDHGGLLDGDVRDFIQALMAQQPGHFRVAEIQIERVRDIDASYLAAARYGTLPATLKSKIDLEWVGVQAKSSEDP